MIDLNSLSSEERKEIEARREYQRKWRAANRDRVKQHNRRFYAKKAAELTADKKILLSETSHRAAHSNITNQKPTCYSDYIIFFVASQVKIGGMAKC